MGGGLLVIGVAVILPAAILLTHTRPLVLSWLCRFDLDRCTCLMQEPEEVDTDDGRRHDCHTADGGQADVGRLF